MDTSDIGRLASSMNQSRTAEAVQMAMLKKSMELNAQSGVHLIQAATSAGSRNPPHLGSRIDVYA